MAFQRTIIKKNLITIVTHRFEMFVLHFIVLMIVSTILHSTPRHKLTSFDLTSEHFHSIQGDLVNRYDVLLHVVVSFESFDTMRTISNWTSHFNFFILVR